MDLHLTINGFHWCVDVEPRASLLTVLRQHLGLLGTRYGCATELCGACTVLVDGKPEFACTMAAEDVSDRPITTLEGVQDHPLRQPAGQPAA